MKFRRIRALGAGFLLFVATLTGVPLVRNAPPAAAQASCPTGTTAETVQWGTGGGFQWLNNAANSGATASNTYTFATTGRQMTVGMSDPDARNSDTNSPLDGPLGNTFRTQTNGIYGDDFLTLVNTSLTSAEEVTWSFSFDRPVLIQNFQISDIDWHGFRRNANVAASFEDEIDFVTARGSGNVPFTATTGSAVTQAGSNFLASSYNSPFPTSNTSGGLAATDPDGRITVNSTGPITSLSFDHSNGPNDATQDALHDNPTPQPPIPDNSPGVSDSHAIAINEFRVCVGERTIGDTVWADVDNDGVQDPNEPGIAGVTVELRDSAGNVVATTTTDANGNYNFTEVVPFNWTVRITAPANYTLGFDRDGGTDGQAVISTADLTAGNVTNADFGLVPDRGSVSGQVFEDYNDNGVLNSGLGESGIGGVTVNLIGTDLGGNSINLSTTTAADGTYNFANIPAGNYTVTEVQPAGYLDGQDTAGPGNTVVSNDNILVGLDPLESSGGNNFADVPDSSLTGTVFEDANNNGTQDTGDNGIANVTITLENETTGVTLTTTTAADGTYSFTGFGPGTYTVTETQPAGFLDGQDTVGDQGGTLANDEVSGIVLAPNEDAAGYNFAEIPGTSIAGSVVDENSNPIPGVTITLTGTNDLGTITALTTTTASDGSYAFSDLRPGTYIVTETQPATHGDGGETAGSAGGTVADDQISGIVLGAGQTSTGNNFDEVTGSIAGSVVDEAGNPIGGVTVTLSGTEATPSGAAVNRTTTTASDGTYSFDNVLGGTYTLTETQPSGYGDGTETAGTAGGSVDNTPGADAITNITLTGGQNATGYVFTELLSSISGTVFLDEDNSGTQDLPGDNGIAGVTITLLNTTTFATQNTTTNVNGAYTFSNLPAGTYTVIEQQPGNYVDGTDTVGSAGGTLSANDTTSGITVTGNAATGYNFAELPSAGVSGTVVDDDGDPISGVVITLTGTNDLGATVNQTFSTGANGQFVFFGLRAGTYAITETQPAGYGNGTNTNGSIPGNAGTDTFTAITLGADDVSNGFVFEETRGSITGSVSDTAGNPIDGVTLTLTGTDDRGNTVSTTTTTNATGGYEFDNLFSGTYTVTETQPAGYQDGTDTAGTAGGTAANPGDAISGITLSGGQNATGYNFVEELGALAGEVYEDLNANGIRDSGEPGIAGVEVTLTGTDLDGDPIAPRTETTNALGQYVFDNLEGGTYTLTEAQPAAFTDGQDRAGLAGGTPGITAGSDQITGIVLPLGQSSQGYIFGEVEPNSIAGTVFLDPNNNGTQDGSETGLGGVTVTLTGTDDFGATVNRTTTSASDGSYSFTGLRPGTYTVTETQPAGNIDGIDTVGSAGGSNATNDAISGIVLTSDQDATGYNFAELEGSSIAGSVTDDQGDPIAGVTINWSGTTDTGTTVSGSVTTAADGTYVVGSLRPGTYTITEIQPAAYGDGGQSAGTSGGDDTSVNDEISGIVLNSGEDATGYDFDETTGSLSGRVYNDLNGDGTRQPGEPGIAGVDMELVVPDGTGGTTTLTATTNGAGVYSFSGLIANGPYVLSQAAQPAGFADGAESLGNAATPGALPAVDDDSISAIEISGGQSASGYNFGEVEGASISGTVVADDNDNGVADGGESGISGVELTLSGTDALGRTVTGVTATTDGSGNYSFADLYPGTYTITETQPAAFFDGDETAGTGGGTVSANDTISGITVGSGDDETDYDFGELEAASIAGSVVDTLGNPIAGVTVTLTGGPSPVTATTDAAGNYIFTTLEPGTYTVTETQPTAYGDGDETAGSAGGDDSVDDVISGITVGSAEAATGYNFTETLGSITGRVYEDANANLAFNSGEPGIGGVDVTLTDAGGNATTIQTAADGTFTFDNLIGEVFTIVAAQPAGYADGAETAGTAGGSVGNDVITAISLNGGQDATGYLFGEVQESSIAGSVEDENGDPIAGVQIAFSGTDYRGTAVTGSVLTQTDGTYTIANLRPGTYTITETQPPAYGDGTTTAGSAGGDDTVNNVISGIVLGSDENATGYDFTETLGSIAGFVYNDLNANGVRDTGEPGLDGVDVVLGGGSAPITVSTNSTGAYLFDDLLAGTYTVTQPTQPTGLLDGAETAGSTGGTVGSTAGTDTISAIALAGGADSAGNNFGEIEPSSISGSVILDDDNDGVADPDETGIGGVDLTLTGTDDFGASVSVTVSTNGTGDYTFPNVRPGTYTLTQTQPISNIDGAETAGTAGGTVSANDTISGIAITPDTEASNYDFGELVGSSISGTVRDEAGNPIAGVTITLTGTDDLGNAVSTTVQTAADGTYAFGGLRPGDYTVTEAQPAGYGDGGSNVRTFTLASGDNETDVDFVETLGSIAGSVYEDLNVDGDRDGGEPGIDTVTITLTGTDVLGDGVSLTTTTAADGSFTFDNLIGGTYAVSAAQPAAYLDGEDSSPAGTVGNDTVTAMTLAGGADIAPVLFGEVRAASISGTVVNDTDNDGVADTGETGIGGVEITLTGTDDRGAAVSATASTSSSGDYSFTGLRPGTYTVAEAQPTAFLDGSETAGSAAGTVSANDTISGIALNSGTLANNYDFGELPGATISGTVLDENGNPIPNVTLTVDGTDDLGNAVSVTATTNAAGNYTFTGLRPGTYTVTESQPTGYGDGGNNVTATIALTPGGVSIDNDFTETLASVAALVFLDTDNDGVVDAGESGIGGVDVTLSGTDDLGNAVSITTATAADGTVVFDDLISGTYTITEVQPSGFIDGLDAAPAATGTAGNDVITGVVVGGGEDIATATFGELEGASIAGSVDDELGNPIPGVSITVSGTDDLGNAVSVTVATNASGNYLVTGLRPGNYTVTEAQPTGYGDGGNNTIPVTLTSGGASTGNDFSETLGSIAGSVFNDANNNGVRDTGESGIGGVEVTLTGTDALGNAVSLTTTTAADGSYTFDDLIGGTYEVAEPTQPPGVLDGDDASPLGSVGNDAITGIALGGGVDLTGVTFGEIDAASIAGTVFDDTDNDGVRDTGEAGIDAVTLTLTGTDDRGDAVSVTETTNASGDYTFSDLRPGTYTVTEVQPPAFLDGSETAGTAGGTVSANDTISGIALGVGSDATGYDFGEIAGSSITGTVLDEINRPIENVTITLTGTDDLGNAVSLTTTTAIDGTYGFPGLRPGTYTVTESQPAGYGDGGSNVRSGITITPGGSSAGNDFSETLASVAALVFLDADNDGVVDGGESGIAGVDVTLSGTDDLGNAVSVTTATAADGTVLFDDLISGTYTITETQPSGFIDGLDAAPAATGTAGNDVITGVVVGGGEDIATATFGELEGASIAGSVAVDDGTALGGVTITLTGTDDLGNAVTLTTTTAADGSYSFTGLRPGSYTITETQPTGYGSANSNTRPVTLDSGDDVTGINFTETLGSLAGSVYEDLNANGVRNAGEPGISGILVAFSGTDANGTTVSASATTDASGNYIFDDLLGGTYAVSAGQSPLFLDGQEASPAGTVGNDTVTAIPLAPGDDLAPITFGEVRAGQIRGTVVNDADNDGVADSGEAGLAGVTITLTGTDDLGNTVNQTATTNASGNYAFVTLRPGTYTLTESQPAGVLDGGETPGSAGGTVSANDVISGITLESGTIGINYDFGELAGSTVSGSVDDEAGNPIPNVTITLTGTDDLGNAVSLTTTTLADGSYNFTGLRPGTYTVTESQPTGYGDGGSNVISGITVAPGGSSTGNDFQETLGSITAVVFDDVDNDGVRDTGENGIAGVDVTLSGTDDLGNTVNVTAATGTDGTVLFDNLISGTYTITETQPGGFLDGIDAAPVATGTAGNDVVTGVVVGGGEDIATATFGEIRPASISGSVADTAGRPIAGVTITLTGTDDLGAAVSLTTTTDATGDYSFSGLRPGTYTVTETQPDGYGDGDGNVRTPLTLEPNETLNNVDFEETLGRLSGFVYEDLNANGVREAGEPGIAGVAIALSGGASGGFTVNLTATTGANGAYSFTDLVGGDAYEVSETQPAGFADGQENANGNGTAGNDIITAVTVPDGGAATNLNFGEVQEASISGTVVLDTDNDGVADTGETGLGGVVITLTGTDDLGAAVNLTASTATDGTYTFSGLRPGTYTVTETQPASGFDGNETAGSAGGTVSANDTISGITLGSGATATGYDFGELPGASISGSVDDEAGNPIGNVTITLTGTDDLGATVSLTTTTAADGSYSFGPLRPGDYTVTESQPAGYGDGGNNVLTLTLDPGETSTGNDFTETLGSLSGSVFEDEDVSGNRNGTEPGIGGVLIALTGTDVLGNAVTASATTAADGTFTFDDLIGGTYRITAAQNAGFLDGDDSAPAGTVGNDDITAIPLAGGDDLTNFDFGELRAAQIRGTVVNDTDNDGVADAGETGIAGVELTLAGTDHRGATVNATATTNSSGNYVFPALRPGTYTVTETQPAAFLDGAETAGTAGGTVSTNDTISGITLLSGTVAFDNDFGELPGATISGSVDDEAGDPIAGVTITLTGTDDNGDPVSLTTTTAADGSYSFSGLRPGDYTITESQPAGYGDGGNNVLTVTLDPGETSTGNDFTETLGSLSAIVFEDLDADGSRDAGEPAIAGVEVVITGTDVLGNNVNSTGTTGSDGRVTFDDLIAGTYTLTETQPAAYVDGQDAPPGAPTSPNGTAGNDVVSGIVVAAGDDVSDATFGEVLAAEIGGRVYLDANNDGTRQTGEGPVGGVTLTLTGTDDLGAAVSLTTTTTPDGTYSFSGLRPGTYTVTETQPTGLLDGTGNEITGIVLGSGDTSADNNFGELEPATISGSVDDEAGDPIAGVTITLTGTDDNGDPVSLTTTTAVDGSYSFGGLRPGDYTITESQPAGYGDGGNNVLTVTVDPGDDSTGNDFTETLGSLSGQVFIDLDGDGIRDAAENGAGGVQVVLTNSTGGTLSVTTAADGTYVFDNLLGGTYTVTEVQPAAFLDGIDTVGTGGGTLTANDTITGAVVPDGGDISGYNFAELPAASISGTVEDELGRPIGGVTLTLTGTDDLGNPVSQTVTTLADGTYTFGPLRPGTYTVTESQPTGYGDGGNNVIDNIDVLPDQAVTGIDFTGTLGSIAGAVFDDLNANGTRDTGEPGIDNVTLTLSGTDANGDPVTVSGTTSATGAFLFDDLVGGSYSIVETQPGGFFDGADTPGTSGGTTAGADEIAGITLGGGVDATGYLFGEVRAGSISGSVVVDTDNDGVADAGEAGIGNITVTLTGTDDLGSPVPATTVITAADGSYSFTGLRPGTYTVIAAQSASFFDGNETPGTAGGTVSANDTISAINIGSGTDATGYDFGELPAAAIDGTVNDDAGNPIDGVTITLTGTDDQGNPVNLTATTALAGSYSFGGLRPGNYTVTETQPAGYGDGQPNTFTVTLDPGENETIDFVDELGSLSGSVVEDVNNNGTRETGDIGQSGVVIQLTGTDAQGDAVSLTTTTGTDGRFTFDELVGGTYTLTELTEPAGLLDGADSGPSGTPGTNANGRDEIDGLTLTAGDDATGYVFGEVRAGSITAQVFEDNNNEGDIDTGENGIGGVTVTLSGTDDRGATVSVTAITNAAGEATFAGLRPGTYVLNETQPAGYADGIDGSSDTAVDTTVNDQLGNIVVGSGENSTGHTFGEVPFGSISGTVSDTAGRPIGGVTITVTGTDDLGNPVSVVVTTQPDGTYTVPNLRPGDYDVTESQPTGYGDGGNNVLGVTLDPGETSTGNDYVETLGSIAGLVFEDTNNNGVQDTGEPGIGGASVFLTGTDANGAAVSESAVTLTDGTWLIDDLVGGAYTITEAQPAGFIDGIDTAGSAGGTNSANDVISGIALAAAEDATGYTFGEIDVASISGAVRDDQGQPISGVTLTLTGTDDTGASVSLVVTSGLDGVYSFNALRPGTYTVTETQPTGYGDGPDTVGSAGGANSANDVLSGIVLAPNEDATGYDFAETTSSISATVFVDTDNDGVSDTGETGIGGIDVTLTGTDDRGAAVNTTVQTAADGTVTFDGLVSGTYTLTAAQSPAHLDGSDTAGSAGGAAGNDVISGITLAIDTDATDYDFGELPAASISGTVLDENGGPIGGVTITVTGTDDLGNPVSVTVTSGPDGSYDVPGLRPGTYTVTQTQPPGYGSSTPNTVPVTLTPGADETVDFTETFGSIRGSVFDDLDGDGIRDAGEPGIAGATVSLIGTDVNGAAVSLTATTGTNGGYNFDDLVGGTYSLVETQPTGFEDGTDAAGTAGGTAVNPGDLINGITLPGGDDATGYTFGEVQLSSLSGSVIEDANNNGEADSGEAGIGGVTVTLTGTDDLGGAVSATATTAADGSYTFDNLRPGTYQVVADQDPNFLDGAETAGTAGGEVTADDPSVANDTVANIALGSGEAATDYDFGELTAGSISGTVTDENGDPIGGVTITVTGTDDLGDPVSVTVTTGPDGSYDVPGLRPGTYTVTQTQPDGYGNGSPNVVPVTLDPGEDEVVDFDETLGSISGSVFDDLDGNGTRDAGEPGIGSVDITLTGTDVNGNPVSATAITDANGDYTFDGLVGGDYTITETQPAGFLDGVDNLGSAGGDDTTNDVFAAITLLAADDATGYEFAELAPASLSGNVSNGAGDPIDGVIVTLTGTDDLGNPVNTTFTTGPDGTYEFSDLRPGTYTITEATPVGYGEGGDSAGSLGGTVGVSEITDIVVTPGDVGTDYNFVDTLGALSGLVFHDVNENDVFDATDAGIVGVTLTLTGTDVTGAAVSATTTTAGDGTYTFDDLLEGTYTITETQPFGFTDSVDTAGDLGGDVSVNDVISGIAVGAGQVGSGYTFAETGNVVSGQVFLDNNANGVRDADDTQFLSGVVIELIDSTGTVIRTTTTDSSGGYLFDGIPAGDYTIRQTQPPQWGSSTPNDISVNISGGGQSGLDFGETPASISGVVFNDAGNDGVSSGDAAIAGQVVELLDGTGNIIATATTGTDGAYAFVGLEAGDYSVRIVPPAGQTFSPAETGADDLIDSDFDPATGIVNVPLGPGENRVRVDAGITPEFYDLSVTVSVPKNEYRVNETVPFTVVVTNNSNVDTPDGFTVTIPLPAGSSLESAIGNGWTITRNGSVLTAVYTDTLTPGQTAPPIAVSVKRATVGALSLPAEVAFNSGITESNTNNNRDSAVVEITSRNLPVPVPSLPVTGVTTAVLLAGGVLMMLSGRGLLFFAGKKRDDDEDDESLEAENAESVGK